MSLKKYKHVIWDWNGTLLNDAWFCVEIICSMLAKRNMPILSNEDYRQVFTFPIIEYYQILGFDFSKEPFESISDDFIAQYEQNRNRCELRKGVHEILNQISRLGITQSILSASKRSFLLEAVSEYKLQENFMAINGLDNHHAASKIDVGTSFIAEQDFKPNEALLIGDTTHDVEVAEAMGVDCYLIPSGHQSYERLSTCGVPIINELSELY